MSAIERVMKAYTSKHDLNSEQVAPYLKHRRIRAPQRGRATVMFAW
jgi:hypothetical protein